MCRILLLKTQGLELEFSKDRIGCRIRLLRDLILEQWYFRALDRDTSRLGINKFRLERLVVMLNVEDVVVLLVFLGKVVGVL